MVTRLYRCWLPFVVSRAIREVRERYALLVSFQKSDLDWDIMMCGG
jgi:hypothetical protein